MKKLHVLVCTVAPMALAACGGGGSNPQPLQIAAPAPPPLSAPLPASQPQTASSTDQRIMFDTFAVVDNLQVHGEVSREYRVGKYQPASDFPSTDKYEIANHGFFEVEIKGRHTGVSVEEAGPEALTPGAWLVTGNALRANLNKDSSEDFLLFEFVIGARNDQPKAQIHAFVNDGKGNFRLSNDTVFADGEAVCLKSGPHVDKPSPDAQCGVFTHGDVRHPIVVDLNGDGISDIFYPSLLLLSNAEGKLENRSNTLPDIFFGGKNNHLPPLFMHDIAVGDATGNGHQDIFVPVESRTKHGYWFDGSRIDECPGCNAQVPWTMLINDGKGNFTANHNFPLFGVGADHPLLNTHRPEIYVGFDPVTGVLDPAKVPLKVLTATIADFNNNGFGDVAVAWWNPALTAYWGMGDNSAGAVYLNDGKNDWRNKTPILLPRAFFGANNLANDMEAFDFDGDGFVDIVLASTRAEPYYDGRVIQFFRNIGGTAFEDVTDTANPNLKFVNGPTNGYWNGEGRLTIVDFNRNGCKDIVDSGYNTYVLLNDCKGNFQVFDDLPLIDGNAGPFQLNPIDINGEGLMGFVGHRSVVTDNSSTSSWYLIRNKGTSTGTNMAAEAVARPIQYSNMALVASSAVANLMAQAKTNSPIFSVQTSTGTQFGSFGRAGPLKVGGMTSVSSAMNSTGGFADQHSTSGFLSIDVGSINVATAFSNADVSSFAVSQLFGPGSARSQSSTSAIEATKGFRFGDVNLRSGVRYSETRLRGFTENATYSNNFSVNNYVYRTGSMVTSASFNKGFFVTPTTEIFANGNIDTVLHLVQDSKLRFNTGGSVDLTTQGNRASVINVFASYGMGARWRGNYVSVNAVQTNLAGSNYTLTLGKNF